MNPNEPNTILLDQNLPLLVTPERPHFSDQQKINHDLIRILANFCLIIIIIKPVKNQNVPNANVLTFVGQ